MAPRLPWLALVVAIAGCSDLPPTVAASAAALEPPVCDDEPSGEVGGFMSETRILRRMFVALSDRLPTLDEYQELLAIPEGQREAWLDAKLEEMLAAPAFYDRMFEFAQIWVSLPPHIQASMANNYRQTQHRWLTPCPAGTLHAGALRNTYDNGELVCDGINVPRRNSSDPEGQPVLVTSAEPWWAPGTTVTVVGRYADTSPTAIDPSGEVVDCGRAEGRGFADAYGSCGCGPNYIYCTPLTHREEVNIRSETSPHRQLWEEPARLFAHLAWHDRPATDWIVGDYTVGPKAAQSVYVRHGRQAVAGDTARAAALDESEWWRTNNWTAPTDPHHAATDPLAWSEFPIEARHPLLVADRNIRFDPRVEPAENFQGMPSAGMLTSLGVTTHWGRERVRGARLMEILACEDFTPPPGDQHFTPYVRDPGAEGACMHCHTRIDPASIHFKRFTRAGGEFPILGLGSWQLPERWNSGEYPYDRAPYTRMVRLWDHDLMIAPVDEATLAANPEAAWMDFLPPDQTLLGQTSDGTIGPLGFAKMVVASGAFDRCLVRRLHEAVTGRDIDPQQEAGYLAVLTRSYVDGGRVLRPLIADIVRGTVFRRGL